jgi:uncharacterized protein (TIGR03086 family)
VSVVEALEALTRATAGYQQRLAAVGAEQWDQPSVCSGWTVKDVADHVLGGNRFAAALAGGASSDDALAQALTARFDGDPTARFIESASSQLDAFKRPGALDAIVHHPPGDISGRTFLYYLVGDLLLHGWDLARSTGGDDQLDDDLVPDVWREYQPLLPAATENGAFGNGPTGDLPDDAPLALRLLDVTGRRR